MRGEIRDFKSGKSIEPPQGGDANTRRLAAIVAGDISGFSRLMELDEEGTLTRVKRIERDLIQPSISEHHGRLVKTTGDGFIAIFDSPVEAVRCGIVIQQSMIGRNAALPKHHWIEYRIGVNLGDVIIEPDDVYGDGVNIAARLENIADPGQVYISGGVYEQIKHKLVCGYQSLGDRKIKNITDPVRVYRVLPDAAAVNQVRRQRQNFLILATCLVLLALAGGALAYMIMQQRSRVNQAVLPPSVPAESAKSVTPSNVVPPNASPSQQATVPLTQPAPAAQTAAPAVAAQPLPQQARAISEPAMIAIRGGSFAMGSNEDISEKPTHQVTVKPFSIGKYPVTVGEWNECAAAKACTFTTIGKDDAPVSNVSWSDAKQYVAWLAAETHKPYRLPSEAEWEYAARGGTQTKYWWGDQLQSGMANCKSCSDNVTAEQPMKVGSFKANPFGLYDMGGGIDQWVEDCWHKNYQGAPSDASVWTESDCSAHVIRSGSWRNDARYVRPANRDNYDTNVRYPTHGFRVALSP
jgi:formylglycine-generating enzyme required for sulfatase activity/class 3 adenylate cyclase